MIRGQICKIKVWGILLSILCLFPGCGGGVQQVVGDYALSVANSKQVTLTDITQSPSIVVGPTIVGLNNNGKFIIGEVKQPEEPFDLGAEKGFFIVYVESKSIVRGLEYAELVEILRESGVIDFSLMQPSLTYSGNL